VKILSVILLTLAPVEPADYACGRGWHLNSKGICVANRHGPPPGSIWGNPNRDPLSPQTQYNYGLPPPPPWQDSPPPWGGPPPPPNW
jgi:hypothetical protein